MFRLIVVLSWIGATLLFQPVARATEGCTALKPGDNRILVTSSGQSYPINLVLPASFDAKKRVPLVIGLHPSGGDGDLFDQDTGMRAAASSKGFAVIFPDGGIRQDAGRYWNIPGVPLIGGGAVPGGSRDDIRFIGDVIDHVVKNSCVDARHIFVTGMSGGARMASMVGCRLADRVTAVAPVAGLRAGRGSGPEFAQPDPEDCRPARPISVLALHGTDDPTNPFPGGAGQRWGYSVDRAMARWASLDHCGTSRSSANVSAQVTRESYGACGGGSEVVLYKIDAPRDQGGGHVWPGGQSDLSTRAAGSSSKGVDLDATQVVLEFFSRQ